MAEEAIEVVTIEEDMAEEEAMKTVEVMAAVEEVATAMEVTGTRLVAVLIP